MPAPKEYSEKRKVLIVLEGEMIERIEQYWHEQQLKNRNEAIKTLLEIALKKEQQD